MFSERSTIRPPLASLPSPATSTVQPHFNFFRCPFLLPHVHWEVNYLAPSSLPPLPPKPRQYSHTFTSSVNLFYFRMFTERSTIRPPLSLPSPLPKPRQYSHILTSSVNLFYFRMFTERWGEGGGEGIYRGWSTIVDNIGWHELNV